MNIDDNSESSSHSMVVDNFMRSRETKNAIADEIASLTPLEAPPSDSPSENVSTVQKHHKAKPKRKKQSKSKFRFIAKLIEPGTLTSKEIAQKVFDKFTPKGDDEDFRKALMYVGSVPYHLKKKGLKPKFAKSI